VLSLHFLIRTPCVPWFRSISGVRPEGLGGWIVLPHQTDLFSIMSKNVEVLPSFALANLRNDIETTKLFHNFIHKLSVNT